ncbi:helix-turn-helix domain-containing protein [Alteribacillus sp. HJP-4]|uniref:helix-turn-helix domain-containing protein n=1 Tax=Alteribacillus sp. HJP-4 TaxID=2775394 RepID=UPI0035CCD372
MAIAGNFPDPLELLYFQNSKQETDFHSHEDYEIFYFHGSKCNYLIGDRIFNLAPGDLILMNGLTLHSPHLFDSEDYIRTVIHFDQGYFREVLRTMGKDFLLEPFSSLQFYRFRLRGKEKKAIEQFFEKMHYYNTQKDPISGYRMQIAFLDLLAHLYSFCRKPLEDNKEVLSEKEKNVQKVISFIERRYQEELTLEYIAQELHLSKFYLSKIFREVTGLTIFNYLYQKRINQARVEFLISEDISMTEVCYKLGFKYPSHFSKVFKSITGLTPQEYKKSLEARKGSSRNKLENNN